MTSSNHAPGKSPGRFRGVFPGCRARGLVPFRNHLELDYLYVLDHHPGVRTYHRADIRLAYDWGGSVWSHYPSFQVSEQGGEVLADCVVMDGLQPGQIELIRSVSQDWCRAHAWAYRLVSPPGLYQGCRLSNVKLLWRFARHRVDPVRQSQVYGLLARQGTGRSLIELALSLSPSDPAQAYPDLLSLAFHHQVEVPLDEAPLGPRTCVSIRRCE